MMTVRIQTGGGPDVALVQSEPHRDEPVQDCGDEGGLLDEQMIPAGSESVM